MTEVDMEYQLLEPKNKDQEEKEPEIMDMDDIVLKKQVTDYEEAKGEDPFRKNLEKRRWWIFGLIALASYSNCGQWIQYMGIQEETREYYNNATKSQVIWFGSAWTITFPLCSYFSSFVLHWNFKVGILFAITLNFSCAMMRYFGMHNYQVALSGSMLAGISATFTLECPVFFAQTWFHAKERLMVVTLLVQLTYFANATLYLLSPWVTNGDYNKIDQVNLIHLYLAAIPFVMGWIVMKSKPDKRPNLTAGMHKGSFKDNAKQLLNNKQYLLQILMFGIIVAHSYTICPAIEIILEDLKLQPVQIGSLGFAYNMTGIISGLGIAIFMNRCKGSRKYFDSFIKGSVAATFLCLVVFGFLAQFTNSYTLMVVMAAIMGFFMLASIPLCCTAIDECSFPADENLSQNGIFLLGNLLSFCTTQVYGIEGISNWLKCHLLTIVFIPVFVYVCFFYKTTFKKSDREGKTYSSFN